MTRLLVQAQRSLTFKTLPFSRYQRETLAPILVEFAEDLYVDGEALAQLMIDHDVGVSVVASYEVKKVDSDYFTEA